MGYHAEIMAMAEAGADMLKEAHERHKGEYRRGLQEAWDAINKWIKRGELNEPAASVRNGMVLAANQVMELIVRSENEKRNKR